MKPHAEDKHAEDKSETPRREAKKKSVRRPLGTGGVMLRFSLRLLILLVLSSIGTIGFARSLETLCAMAAVYCSAAATLRREDPFGPALTHFDEAAAYSLCALAASKFAV